MLLRTMFLVALLAVIGETIVHGAAALAQIALRQRAVDAARTAFVSGVQAAQTAAVQGGVPAPVATCAYADADGCEMNVETTFATPTPADAPTPAACPGTACTVVMQGNSSVSEGRATYSISSVIRAANGAPLASRAGMVTFRTFATAPFASVVGSTDGTLDALMNGGTADDGGATNTLITVEYDPNGGDGATTGNVWQPVVESPVSEAPAWER